jgi:hypothetical protein
MVKAEHMHTTFQIGQPDKNLYVFRGLVQINNDKDPKTF